MSRLLPKMNEPPFQGSVTSHSTAPSLRDSNTIPEGKRHSAFLSPKIVLRTIIYSFLFFN